MKIKRKISSIKEFLDGSILTQNAVIKQLPFIFFLTFLAIFYIGNSYHAERVVRDINNLQKEIKELRSESITLASELMDIRRQSEISKLIKKYGIKLEESNIPPKKIVIKK